MVLGSGCVYFFALWIFFAFAPNLDSILWEALPGLGLGMILNAVALGGSFLNLWLRYKDDEEV